MSNTAPLNPEFHFDKNDRAELESCRYDVTDQQSLSVIELATAWAMHVQKIAADRTALPSEATTWGPHDLIAALYLRDFLAKCLDRLSPDLSEKVTAAIQPYDLMFRSITQDDHDRLVERFAEESVASKRWWWRRIPNSGPIFDELRE